jgi:hypothetical protein
MNTHSVSAPTGCRDVTPLGCDLFARNDESAPVLLLNEAAPPALLLGYLYGRCSELLVLANLATCGSASEDDLKDVTSHIGKGLQMVLSGLDCLSSHLPCASQENSASAPKVVGIGRRRGTGGAA